MTAMLTRPISLMSPSEKVVEAIKGSKEFMPGTLWHQVEVLLSPANLAIMMVTLTVWAGSHFFGVGEVVDVVLLLVGAFTLGWSIEDVVRNLITFGTSALGAQNEADIKRASKAFAEAVIVGGIDVVMAILLRRSARGLQATRGAAIEQVARPRGGGLQNVGPDSQAGKLWRKPTVTGDPTLPAGEGATTPFGDVTYSTQGSATEQQLTRLHELVHSSFSPRLGLLRTFRARLRMSAYSRSVIMTYLEEALAESFAQLRINGLSGLLTGIRFPIANGYITLQQLACEGAEIGTIIFGAERFSAQLVLTGPSPE